MLKKMIQFQTVSFGFTSGNVDPNGQNGASQMFLQSPKSKPGTAWGMGPSEEEEAVTRSAVFLNKRSKSN